MAEKKERKFPEIFIDMGKIEDLVDDMLEKIERQGNFDPQAGIMMGFHVKIDPSGNANIVEMKTDEQISNTISAQTEPLVEIQNQENAFLINAELPGVTKEQISLNCEANELTIQTKNSNQNFFKKIRFLEELEPTKVTAEFHNGILEIRAPKQAPQGQGKPVEIR